MAVFYPSLFQEKEKSSGTRGKHVDTTREWGPCFSAYNLLLYLLPRCMGLKEGSRKLRNLFTQFFRCLGLDPDPRLASNIECIAIRLLPINGGDSYFNDLFWKWRLHLGLLFIHWPFVFCFLFCF